MPHLTIRGVSFFYEDTGGPGPAIVFSHGLLMSSRMWAAQMQAFKPHYRCIAYRPSRPGQRSDPGGRIHDMETCYRDAVSVIEGPTRARAAERSHAALAARWLRCRRRASSQSLKAIDPLAWKPGSNSPP